MAQVFAYPSAISAKEMTAATGFSRERTLFVIRNARLDPDWAQVQRSTMSIAGRAVASLIQQQGHRRSLSHLCDVAARRRRFQSGFHSVDVRRAAQRRIRQRLHARAIRRRLCHGAERIPVAEAAAGLCTGSRRPTNTVEARNRQILVVAIWSCARDHAAGFVWLVAERGNGTFDPGRAYGCRVGGQPSCRSHQCSCHGVECQARRTRPAKRSSSGRRLSFRTSKYPSSASAEGSRNRERPSVRGWYACVVESGSAYREAHVVLAGSLSPTPTWRLTAC